MNNRKSILLLRGKANQELTSDTELLAGQPYASLKKNRLYIGLSAYVDGGNLNEPGNPTPLYKLRPIGTNDYYVWDSDILFMNPDAPLKYRYYNVPASASVDGIAYDDVTDDDNETAAFIRMNEKDGVLNIRSRNAGVSIGRFNRCLGNYTAAFGTYNKVEKNVSTAIGIENWLKAPYSYAIGRRNTINTYEVDGVSQTVFSVACGNNNKLTGLSLFVGGTDNILTGNYGVMLGRANESTGEASVSIGYSNSANGKYSTSIGYNGTVTGEKGIVIGSGKVEKLNGVAIGNGGNSTGEGAIIIGTGTSSAYYSTAIGLNNTATQNYAVALGSNNKAKGWSSFVSGNANEATGHTATVLGYLNVASNQSSVAMGQKTKTGNTRQLVTGYYNEGKMNTLFEIGNGTAEEARKNIFEVLVNGLVNSYYPDLIPINASSNSLLRSKDVNVLNTRFNTLESNYNATIHSGDLGAFLKISTGETIRLGNTGYILDQNPNAIIKKIEITTEKPNYTGAGYSITGIAKSFIFKFNTGAIKLNDAVASSIRLSIGSKSHEILIDDVNLVGYTYTSSDTKVYSTEAEAELAFYMETLFPAYYLDNLVLTSVSEPFIQERLDSEYAYEAKIFEYELPPVFEVLNDGRAKVYSAPIEDNDVVRLSDIKTIIEGALEASY